MPEATRFGKYLLFERIAVGGMAEVFRAKPVGGENLLALKRIHPHHLENDDFVSMLIDEAKISVQLNHPNVVQVVDLGRVDNHYFIAMEFIAGRDLRRVMERLAESGRGFPPEHAVAIIAAVARGLDYAHGKSDARGQKMEIIHRDISPQNVLVGFDGMVKVIDFGIAKAAGRLMETQVGILKGKYAYMSPEQAAGGTLDHRTDIFSTGIMLYECTVGKHPFRATHDIETLRNIKNSSMVLPHEANPRIPDSVETVIMKALAPRKEDRYFTAGAMAVELEKALQIIRPGYNEDTLAEFVGGLFADEIASGGVPEVAIAGDRTMPRAQQSGSMRLDKLSSGSIPVSPRPVATNTKSKVVEPSLVRPESAAREEKPAGPPAWATARDGVTGFLARIQAGKLNPADSIVLGALTVVFVALALILLLWEPSTHGVAHPPIAARTTPIATPASTAALTQASNAIPAATPTAVPGAELLVESTPAGAAIRVNGKPRGQTPLTVSGLPANVAVNVSIAKGGYATWNASAIPGKDRVSATLTLLPRGSVTVTSIPPGAEIRVGGVRQGLTPMRLDLPEGDHVLLLRDKSGAEESRTVHIRGGNSSTERFKLQ